MKAKILEKFEIKRILHIKVEIKALGSPSLFPNANTAKLLQKPHMWDVQKNSIERIAKNPKKVSLSTFTAVTLIQIIIEDVVQQENYKKLQWYCKEKRRTIKLFKVLNMHKLLENPRKVMQKRRKSWLKQKKVNQLILERLEKLENNSKQTTTETRTGQ